MNYQQAAKVFDLPLPGSREVPTDFDNHDRSKIDTLYIIVNGDGEYYVGITSNFPRRLAQHRAGECYSTNIGRRDWRELLVLTIPNYNELKLTETYLQKDYVAVKIVLKEGKVPNDMRLRIMGYR